MTRRQSPRRQSRPLGRLLAGALAGMLAAAVALGVAELAAAITGPQGAPVIAVGEVAINLTPIPVKEFAIAHFGSHDKEALVAGIVVLLVAFAALVGILAVRRIAAGLAGLAAFAAVGAAAAVSRPTATAVDVVPTLAGVCAAAVALVVLARYAGAALPQSLEAAISRALGAAFRLVTAQARQGTDREPATGREWVTGEEPLTGTGPVTGPEAVTDRESVTGTSTAPLTGTGPATEPLTGTGPATEPVTGRGSPDRRRFLIAAAGAAALAGAAGGLGDRLLGRFSIASSRAQVRLPAPAVAAPAVPAGADLRISGLTPFFTLDSSFYRVDTDLILPQVAPQTWTLRIDGMVERELEIDFAELLRMPLTETDITLVCVSNEVGGSYAGNARWLGAPLAGLLRRAGVRAGADQVLSTAADGMTISTPVAAIMDGRDALLAVGMNGQPLPVAHGFPARMVVPGLYGYVSATKWVTRLTLTTFARQRAYWTQRGYAAQAPIKTESRIDVPRPLAQLSAGRVAVAGVAWAPTRGIASVEVSVDGGPWHVARLAAADGIDTWRQWMWPWDATPGLHRLQVRATDRAGVTQPARRAPSFPNGASGWDSVVVTVT